MTRLLAPFLALAAAGCRGPLPVDFFEEALPGSGSWSQVAAEPAWVKSPPPRAGFVRFVADARSNVRGIALSNLDAGAAKDVAQRVRVALRTVVTSPEAEAAAAAVPSSLRLVQRACRDELLTLDPVPGNTLATVWGLYEVPIADLLAPIVDVHRATARAALEQL